MITLRPAWLLGMFLGILWIIGGCVSLSMEKPPEDKKAIAETKADDAASVWFQGTVEEAFESAKSTGKPVFLYWGAVWCPPCNELKSQVFSHPDFPELMQSVIPVYLDGDEMSAQTWGDKLQAAGYPTILILDASYNEYLRINGALSFAEFKDIVQAAVREAEDLDALFVRVEQKKMREEDWPRLAFLDWEQLPVNKISVQRQWHSLDQLLRQRPKTLTDSVQGSLIAQYLMTSYRLRDEAKLQTVINQRLQKKEFHRLLEELFHKSEKAYGARQLLIYRTGRVLAWLSLADNELKLAQDWQKSVETLSLDPRLSVDQKLWSAYPAIEIFRLQNQDTEEEIEYPEALLESLKQAVVEADLSARTNFDRHAVISGAAYLLRQVKLFDEARELLQKEVKSTDTPWYYYSSLANLEEDAGQISEALRYSQLARETARGRATRIQWITNDLLLNLRLSEQRRDEYIAALVREFYEVAFHLDDGFMGRNHSRAERVAAGLREYNQQGQLNSTLASYRKRCEGLKGENRTSCERHFQTLFDKV